MRRKANGFTLAELLVILGIITLLVALLMPALAAVRSAAQTAQCRSNLKNIGAGWTLYIKNNPNKMPLAVSLPAPEENAPPNQLTIIKALRPYIKTPKIYYCPADDKNYFSKRGTSYEYLPGLSFTLDPTNMGNIVSIAKLTPDVVPVLADAAPFHPAPDIATPVLTVYYDSHVDWLFDTLKLKSQS